ncbi:MAG: DUF4347 domain-containing protein [Bacteroidetes bacterium]|nr:DUF4347 domain-containing protein [Bacteroidota bacterium]
MTTIATQLAVRAKSIFLLRTWSLAFRKAFMLVCITLYFLSPVNSLNPTAVYVDEAINAPSSILTAVQQVNGCKEIFHLFSHGRPGELYLNGEWKTAEKIAAFIKPLLARDFKHLNIYGCEFAKGEKGKEAVSYLEMALGISVAASDDITGKDGDWDLEVGSAKTTEVFADYAYNLQACAVNAAQGKTATLSSTYTGSSAANAVDGNTAGSSHTGTAHSNGATTTDYWEVDLGSVQTISAINIFNRDDCCQNRLASMYVLVADTPFPAAATDLAGALANADFQFQLSSTESGDPVVNVGGKIGRYVRLQKSGNNGSGGNYINIAEVQVCTPCVSSTNITPYIRINNGSWLGQSSITIDEGNNLYLGTQTGLQSGLVLTYPDGTTNNSEGDSYFAIYDITSAQQGTYYITYTDGSGCKKVHAYNVTVTPCGYGSQTCAIGSCCRHHVNVANNSCCTVTVLCDETGCGSGVFNMGSLAPGVSFTNITPSAYNATIRIQVGGVVVYSFPALDVGIGCQTYYFDYNPSTGSCAPTQITGQPVGNTICNGGTTTLSVTATNSPTYQWQSSTNNSTWTNISGATSSSYTTPTLTTTTYYRVVLTQSSCTVNSNSATVTVVADPAISAQPTGSTICSGGTASLSVIATGGTPSLTYQWRSSPNNSTWTNIAGATASSYTTPALTSTMYYRVRISASGSGCGTVTSSSATVTVNACVEICNNGIDDDGDGLVDCADPDCGLITNYGFDNGTNDWNLYVQSGNTATFSIDNTSQLSGTNSALINISAVTGTNWHIQFVQGGKSVEAGKVYNLSFQAKAAGNRNMGVALQRTNSPYTGYWYQNAALTTSAQSYSFDFIADSTNIGLAGIYFNLGESTANIWIDNVTFNEVCNPVEICNNGIDDDGDGLVDSNDPDCGSCQGSLLANPGFENNLLGWSTNGPGATITTDAYNGAKALKLSGSNLYAKSIAGPATPGNVYELSVFAKRSGNSGSAAIGLRWFDSGNSLLSTKYMSVDSFVNDFKMFKLTSIAPAGAAYMEVELGMNSGSDIIYDEICLKENSGSGECNCSENLFINGGFETHNASVTFPQNLQGNPAQKIAGGDKDKVPNWEGGGGPTTDFWYYVNDTGNTVNNPEGNYFSWIPGDFCQSSFLALSQLELEDGVEYEICLSAAAWQVSLDPSTGLPTGAPATQGDAWLRLEMGSAANVYTKIQADWALPESSTWSNLNWQHLSFRFVYHSSEPYRVITLTNISGIGAAIDGLAISKVGCSSGSACPYLLNSGFENDLVDWYHSASGVSATTSNPYAGAKSALLTKSTYISKYVPIDRGKNYTLNFYAKKGAGTTWAGVGYTFKDRNGNDVSTYQNQVITSTAWELQTVNLTNIPQNAIFLNFDISAGSGASDVLYVDEVCLSADALAPEICSNGIDDDGDGLVDNADPDCSLCSMGGILFERWLGIGGTTITDLTGNANYPNNPDEAGLLTSFDSPNNIGDSYGTRVRGYLSPTQTGTYSFNVTSDDYSELYLSTSADPNNKVLIASVNGYTSVAEYTKYASQTSANINLVAGVNYYIELLYKEGGGDDHFEVYWKTPSNSSWNIIPGTNLSPFYCIEICGNGIDDDNDGLVDCADSDCQRITLSTPTVSACINQPLQDVATVSVNVSWTNAPANDTLEVSIYGKTEHIFVASATSPQTVTFTVPADGSAGKTITASWRANPSLCTTTATFNAPVACSNDQLGCDILYICGENKPEDGDAWDHGFITYLDKVNGAHHIQ